MSNSRDAPVLRTELRDHLKLLNEGKVREIYELDEVTLLFVATDRISGIVPFHPCDHDKC